MAMKVILTHENADFDAVASLLGASKLFPDAVPVLPRRVNRNGRAFLSLYGAELAFVKPNDLPRRKITHATLVDTQSLTTLRGMGRELQVNIIDHHPLDRELPPAWTFAGEPTGATTTLLIEEISARALTLTSIEATLLLLGIYEDTGSLLYESTTTRDLRAAAWLMEQGARLSVVNEFLHHPLTPEQCNLYELLQEQSETHEIKGHTIVIAQAEASGFSDEISTLAHKLRELLEPSALFVLVGLDKRIQLVARSTTDDIDVSVIAKQFDGGGHARAAAALIRARSLQAVHEKLLELLPKVVQPTVTVAQVMSRGVQVLSSDDKISVAAERMRRTGHEGYPVVSEGRVIGLLTRRAVDQALQHKMADAPVTQVMKEGNITVSRGDSVTYLQQLMIENDWGQIPVVEGDRIIGVVTRTDLITLWGSAPAAPRHSKVSAKLEKALAEPVLILVRHISQKASEMGVVPYFVGGLVRDLLLEHPIVDVDMVIEGDAITLARRLANDLGGRVRTHKRFRTAKWLLSQQVWQQAVGSIPDDADLGNGLPLSVDFATARTEFYTYPTALPQIERSSITQDLHRRDFTINTLAIRLDPDHWGELLDFYGGEADLHNGVIRVLHSLSFVDDPTRILRAARLESRMGFHLDPRSEELISDALPLLKRVSGDRIRHELELIFRETEPERGLRRLEELSVLHHIHPGLRCDRWLQAKYRILREEPKSEAARTEILGLSIGTKPQDEVWNMAAWDLKPRDNGYLHLALLAYRLDREELDKLLVRLKVGRDDAEDIRLLSNLKEVLPQLGRARRPSAVFRLLRPYPSRVLAVAWIATDRRRLQRRLLHYQTKWRSVEAKLRGSDLKAMGLKPGPLFGRLLNALRDARLDGKVSSRADEESLVKKLLAAEGENADQ